MMKPFLTLLILLWLSPPGSAQVISSAETDSLFQLLEKAEGLERAQLLYEYARSIDMKVGRGKQYFERAIALTDSLGEYTEKARLLGRGGYHYRTEGRLEEALELHQSALEAAERSGDKKAIALAYNDIGVDYYYGGDYESAVTNILEALRLREEVGDAIGAANSKNNVAIVLYQMKDFQHSITLLHEAVEMHNSAENFDGTVRSLNNLGLNYQELGKLDSAVYFYSESLALAEKIDYGNGMAYSLSNIGSTYLELGDYKLAEEYTRRALVYYEDVIIVHGIAEMCIQLGEIYTGLGEYDKAMDYTKRGLQVARDIEAMPVVADAYEAMSKTLKTQGRADEALESYQKYSEIRDSLYTTNTSKQVAILRSTYETEQKEREIELLKREAELQSLLIYAAGVVAAIFIVIAFVLYRLVRSKQREVLIRKQSEEELREYQQRLSSVLTNVPIILWSFDRDGFFTLSDGKALSLIGMKKGDAVGRTVFDYFKDYPDILDFVNRALRGESFTAAFRIDSVILETRFTPLLDQHGSQQGVIGIAFDITERRKAEAALRKSELQFRSIWERSLDGMRLMDVNGIITLVNESFCKLVGKSAGELAGKHFKEVYTEDLQRSQADAFEKKLRNGNIDLHLEKKYKLWDGREVWFEVSNAIIDLTGKSPTLLSIFRDVSERKETEEVLHLEQKRLIEAMEDLKRTQSKLVESEKMAALGNLVAGVAHEINTPIGVGVTAVTHLQQKTKDTVAAYKERALKRSMLEKYLEIAEESTQLLFDNLHRASELVQSFKQVSTDQSSLHLREFNVGEYLRNISLSLKHELKNNGHNLQVHCEDGLVMQSYPGAFSQVFTNLIMNSVVHGFGGMQHGSIDIDVQKNEENLFILYRDNGTGIPDDIRDKVFDPFFTTRRDKGGSGLGLHIVYNIITQQLRGDISIENGTTEGAAFRITLPILSSASSSS